MSKHPLPWPRLSETLDGPKNPELCQACGGHGDVHLWMEHDDQDKPTAVAVILCGPCSDRIIESHPRLYARLPKNSPFPGCMPVCVDCIYRDGLCCTHKLLKSNGGPGRATEDTLHANPSEGELRRDVPDVQPPHGVDGHAPGAAAVSALQQPAGPRLEQLGGAEDGRVEQGSEAK